MSVRRKRLYKCCFFVLLVILFIGFASRNSEVEDTQLAIIDIPVWIDETPASWEPKTAPLMTKWAENIDIDNPHPEYPRPTLVREDWKSLNGVWDLEIRDISMMFLSNFFQIRNQKKKILVPFCVESALSGIMTNINEYDLLVYSRSFSIPQQWKGKKIKLNFGAVDYETKVIVNGETVGNHTGGYDSFSFDITNQLKDFKFNQTITVIVKDPTDKKAIPVGKQWSGDDRHMRFIYYTATSGIWQTVWLEPVEEEHVERLEIVPDIDKKKIKLKIVTNNPSSIESATVIVVDEEKDLFEKTVECNREVDVVIGPSMKLWSPKDPFLYGLVVILNSGDEVQSYFGMRKIEIRKLYTFQRVYLNNELLPFQAGPLDQGFWPDGLYTPPSDEAIQWDLAQTLALGFNVIRKHIKIESSRWYYWADRLGLLVWQDFPSMSDIAIIKDEDKMNFITEYTRWMQQLGNHPSIIKWVCFNEGWGQFDTEDVALDVSSLDPSRLVTAASGWVDHDVGHIIDLHVFPGPSNNGMTFAKPDPHRAAVIGEMWGQSMIPWGHCWYGDKDAQDDPRGGFKSVEEYVRAYDLAVEEIVQLQTTHGYNAVIFTQLTDIEKELNGYFSYDRKVQKVDVKELAKINFKMFS